MSRAHRILGQSHLLLRLSLVLALFIMLNIPHAGMTAVAETPMMTMHHSADAPGQMSHSSGVHDGMNGAVCAMLCAGTHRIEQFGQVALAAQFSVAGWTIAADPVRASCTLDPAQRPPDTPPSA